MGYGSFTDRTLAENEPPVYVPEYFSATLAPSAPTLPGKVTVKVPDAPAARVPRVCGNGVPVPEPSAAEVSVRPVTTPVPVLSIVMVAV
jgi:hypothetical protein